MGLQNNCAYLPLKTEHKLKCLCIKIIDNFLLANMKLKPEKKVFLQLGGICFRSRDTSFQSLRNLEENTKKKIEHLVPL